MTRALGLERAETAVYRGASARPHLRRAALEERILAAYFDGDGERLSQLRGELVQLQESRP